MVSENSQAKKTTIQLVWLGFKHFKSGSLNGMNDYRLISTQQVAGY